MSRIRFVIRTARGQVVNAALETENENIIDATRGADLSLNLEQEQISSFVQDGNSLRITLANGQTILVEDFFNADGEPQVDLYVSTGGRLYEVALTDTGQEALVADYRYLETADRWIPDQPLYFEDAVALGAAGFAGPSAGLVGAGLLGVAALASIGGGNGGSGPPPPTVTISPNIAGDDKINAAEHAGGVNVTGTGTPGGSVVVELKNAAGAVLASKGVIVDPTGNWSADFLTSEMPTGEQTLELVATITDSNGLTGNDSANVALDTVAPQASMGTIEGDDKVTAAERSDGLQVAGTGTPGAMVQVDLKDASGNSIGTATTTVAPNGTWSATFPASQIPEGEYPVDVGVTVSDEAGNTSTASKTVTIDTEAPDAFSNYISASVSSTGGLTSIEVAAQTDDLKAYQISGSSVSQLALSGTGTTIDVAPDVPNGSVLALAATDAAGNQSTSIVPVRTAGALDLPAAPFQNLDITLLDLGADEAVDVTLASSDLAGIVGNNEALYVIGADTFAPTRDTVNISGALRQGSKVEAGHSFTEYKFAGQDISIYIEENINVVL